MEEIIIPTEGVIFNLDVIKRGNFIYAKGKTWTEGRNGLIVRANEQEITAIFLTENSAAGYFKIKIGEIGEYEMRISGDLTEVMEYGGDDLQAT